jgi:hypothetical protein
MLGTQAPLTTTQTTTVSEEYVIQETTDYSIFKLLKHNRPVVQSHVAHLAQSMSDRPHLRPSRPVLCNEKMEIIDGQHREKASEINGMSVFFMVVPGLTIDDARLLNALQRTWSLLDYAYSYASSGVPAYVQFVKVYEGRSLPPTIVLEYMERGSKARYNFRIGQLEVSEQRLLDMRLDECEDVIEAFGDNARPYVLGTAFQAVQMTEGYNHKRMMEKLSKTIRQAQPDRVGYIRELERIYNADVQFNGPNYLRFYGK